MTAFSRGTPRGSAATMDAERINSVEHALDDLDQRAAELRRFL
jgi:hypothetical protein